MTKQEWLDALLARTEIAAISNTPEMQGQYTTSNSKTIKWYSIDVTEVNGDDAWTHKEHFYVYDESGPAEAAYNYKKEPVASIGISAAAKEVLSTYMDGQASVVKYNIEDMPGNSWGIIRAFVDAGSSTCNIEHWLVYKPDGQPAEHSVIQNF